MRKGILRFYKDEDDDCCCSCSCSEFRNSQNQFLHRVQHARHVQGALSNFDHSPFAASAPNPALLRYLTSRIALSEENLSKLYISPAQRPETRDGARNDLKVEADSRGRAQGTVGVAETARTTDAQGFVRVPGLKRGCDRCSYGFFCFFSPNSSNKLPHSAHRAPEAFYQSQMHFSRRAKRVNCLVPTNLELAFLCWKVYPCVADVSLIRDRKRVEAVNFVYYQLEHGTPFSKHAHACW